ncbi:MAG: hypothetical protein JSU73_01390 [candidate division WOR-3 bacterium]|nr:MAG: hypothetical protein JSU73_01390 [candidate division WOR-3 bacterium]
MRDEAGDGRDKNALAAVFGKHGVIWRGLYYLRDYPEFVFPTLVVVLVVVLVVALRPSSTHVQSIAWGLIILSVLALAVFLVLKLRTTGRRARPATKRRSRRASVRLAAWGGIVVSVLALAAFLVVRHRTPVGPGRPTTGKIARVTDLPSLPPTAEDSMQQWTLEWINTLYCRTRIVVDKGSRDRVEVGDYFVVPAGEAKDRATTGDLGTRQEAAGLIEVVMVEPTSSVCRLVSYPLERFLQSFTFERLEEEGPSVLSPLAAGQRAIAVPRAEKAGWDAIEELYDLTLDPDLDGAKRRFYHEEIVRKARTFLLDHGNGYFAPGALFQMGYAQFQLEQYADATETFELFLERFHFHPSAPGARDWIRQASGARRAQSRDSGSHGTQ